MPNSQAFVLVVTAWHRLCMGRKGRGEPHVGDVHYVALGLRKSRCILTVHDLGGLQHSKGLSRALYRLLYFSIPLRRCAVITAISENTRDRLTEEFPFTSGRIVVIADPVPQAYEPRPRVFNPDYPRILQVGTAPHKNVARVVQAIEGLPCKLHIVGPLSDELRRLLESRRIDYESSVDIGDAELLEGYDRADMVVFVSLEEGFGMPIIEAQAMGRPVVVSNLSPMKEVAGGGALIVDPFKVEAIRCAIRQIVEDVSARERIIAAELENVKRFSANVVAGQYARLYRSVAGCESLSRES